MNDLLRRDHWVWPTASVILFVVTIAGVATEAGPTAFLASLLLAVTIYTRAVGEDARRLVLASVCFFVLELAASFIPTGAGCGLPIIESADRPDAATCR